MSKEVIIQVASTQKYAEGSEDRIEFTAVGTLYKRENCYYIIYRDSVTTGGDGVTTTLRVEPSKITLNRMGAVDQKQIFEPGTSHSSAYVTQLGTFLFKVFTEEMEIDLTEQGGNITLKYDLFSDEQLVSHNLLGINIKGDAPQ